MDKPYWLKVSLTADGELAEAISEVLSRFTPNGVAVESDVIYNDAEDVGTPVGPARVYAYLPIDEKIDDTRQKILEAFWHLNQIMPVPEPTFEDVVEQDWVEVFKQFYHPIPIGQKLLVLPAWAEQTDLGRIAVRIDPSNAFGTGTHPSTQLCLELIEKYTHPGWNAIDVGCGSGILSIAALKMGAEKALAVDVDAASVRSTYDNAKANEVADRVENGSGSVEEILTGQFSITNAQMVMVNILAPIILRLFDMGLADLVKPDGLLLLSGILDEQGEKIEAAAAARSFTLLEKVNRNDWVAFAFKKSA